MKYIKIFELYEPNQKINTLLLDFGYFLTLNISQLSQYMTDKDISDEIQKQFRSKVVNNMTYTEMMNSDIIKNEKVIPHILGYIKDLIAYIEPRFNKYLNDEGKKIYLPKIQKFKKILADL